MPTSNETFKEFLALPDTFCDCDKCKKMCLNTRPCWGLPSEFKLILETHPEYAKLLMLDYFSDSPDEEYPDGFYAEILSGGLIDKSGEYYGGRTTPFIPRGKCLLLNKDNHCMIHDLKPIEGRKVIHDVEPLSAYSIHYELAKLWNTPEGKEVIDLWHKLIGNYNR